MSAQVNLVNLDAAVGAALTGGGMNFPERKAVLLEAGGWLPGYRSLMRGSPGR